jgi:hypothetical protein
MKQKNYLGLFIKEFGWNSFSITLIEQCEEINLKIREDWYLNKFKSLLNFMTSSYVDARNLKGMWILTKKKN